MKTVLELSNKEAKTFFMREESFCNIELPIYFNFQTLLDKLSGAILTKKINDLNSKYIKDIKHLENINYKFYTNKDGCFSWRPLQIINPVIYICIVNQITERSVWKKIIKRFSEFQANPKIKCCSIPIVGTGGKKSTKKQTIINWWSEIEQKSLEYALDYDCFLATDIVDCYSSIYTHSIPWALHGKETIKLKLQSRKKGDLFGNYIDDLIQGLSYGQTNGIPQGSVLMDFIAEIVLGYADLELSNRIQKYNEKSNTEKLTEYQILRYRDDYRIFGNSQNDIIKIARFLSDVLQELNFKINTQKTFISTNIIKDAIKPDKLYWNESKQTDKSIQKHLLLIHSLAEKYPNSGSLIKALDAFYDRIYPLSILKNDDIKVLVSILIDIAYKNPRTYQLFSAILCKILSTEIDDSLKTKIYSSIKHKFNLIPNIGHLQVWLQRATLKDKPEETYEDNLCKLVNGEIKIDNIWNISWLQEDDKIKNIFETTSIINNETIEKMPIIPEPKEIKIFKY